MKKLFVLVVILMGCYNAFGQKVYCELVGTQATPLSKAAISVDFGQRMRGDVLVDDEGKPLKFNSMIDAMNYMAQRGWEFEAAYPVGKGDLTYHWLLSKTIELRWDGSRNCYYNQDLDPQQRFELHQIKDLISLYEKLGTTDDLLNRNWTDL